MDNKTIQKIVGENIRKQRQQNHLTLEALARFLGITPGFLGLIERGNRGLSFKNLVKISEILNVSIDTFFEDSNAQIDKNDIVDKASGTKIKIMKKLEGMNENELHFILKMILSLSVLKTEDQVQELP